FGYFRDVSTERDALAAFKQSEARFRSLVEAAPDGVVILKHGHIVFTNKRGAGLLGLASAAEALGKPIAAFLPPEDAKLTHERITKMLRDGVEFPPSEYRVISDTTRI